MFYEGFFLSFGTILKRTLEKIKFDMHFSTLIWYYSTLEIYNATYIFNCDIITSTCNTGISYTRRKHYKLQLCWFMNICICEIKQILVAIHWKSPWKYSCSSIAVLYNENCFNMLFVYFFNNGKWSSCGEYVSKLVIQEFQIDYESKIIIAINIVSILPQLT